MTANPYFPGSACEKVSIQLHSVLKASLSFPVSFISQIELKAELKYTDSILMLLILFCRCVKGSRYVILCESVSSETYWWGSRLVGVLSLINI